MNRRIRTAALAAILIASALLSPHSASAFPPRIGGWYLLPRGSHASENGYGLGVSALRHFRGPMAGPDAPDSEIQLKGRLTTKSQKSGEATLEWSPGSGTFTFKTKFSYTDLSRRFWAIGPDSPLETEEIIRPRETLAYFEGYWRVTRHVKTGIRYEYEQEKYLDTDPAGLLATEGYVGAGGGSVSGSGLLVELDTRNRTHSPTSGAYYQGFALIFDEALGSDYDFNNYNIDLRNYFHISGPHVVATQFFFYAARGGAPLWRLAELGGREHTRGYRQGRYRDRLLLAGQVEYRVDVVGRFGLAAFAGLGDVAPGFRSFELEHARPTVGGGLRVRVGNNDPLKARLDVAGGGESVRFYLGFDEAF